MSSLFLRHRDSRQSYCMIFWTKGRKGFFHPPKLRRAGKSHCVLHDKKKTSSLGSVMRGDVSFNLSFESLSIVSSGLSCSFSVTVMLLMMTRDEATAAKKGKRWQRRQWKSFYQMRSSRLLVISGGCSSFLCVCLSLCRQQRIDETSCETTMTLLLTCLPYSLQQSVVLLVCPLPVWSNLLTEIECLSEALLV